MTHEQDGSQRNWRATLRLAVSMGDEIGVASVFSALVWEDGRQIAERAQAFLEAFAPFYFAEEEPGIATLEQRLRMDMFRESVLAYLEGKQADVEQAIEYDIETWIEANAPAIASANLSLMERELGEPGAATHRDVVKLHQLVELETYERIQQRGLARIWADIEATLAELLAAAER